MSVAKRKVMDALNLPEEYRALLTTDDRAALLHAVPLWRVSLKHMARLLKHYRGRYNTVVGFQPTGWSMQTGAPVFMLIRKDATPTFSSASSGKAHMKPAVICSTGMKARGQERCITGAGKNCHEEVYVWSRECMHVLVSLAHSDKHCPL